MPQPSLQDCVPLPHLVVVPLTTINNWERELSIWAPYLRVVSLKGNAAARQLLLDHCMYAPAEGHGRGRSAYQVGCSGLAVHRVYLEGEVCTSSTAESSWAVFAWDCSNDDPHMLLVCLLVQDRVKFHVLLTTYEMVSKHLAQLQRLDLAALIVDEAHRLKNATSRLFQVS